MKNAIVLCSGGIDSVTTAYYVKKRLHYNKILIIFFDYGQRTIKQERKASKDCANNISAEFNEIQLRWLSAISNSLINKEENKKFNKNLKDTKEESMSYYVPCRNSIFLTYALAFAESHFIKNKEKCDIFVGFKCEGQEHYPDTTQKFVNQMNKLSKISCSYHFLVKAPLIKKDKEDIILLGKKLRVNFKKTFSCYVSPNKKHCGNCLACRLRKAGFYWADVDDPTEY
ncbi:MAG: 7-cyano-7-deazaguanine synthase [Nanoarchaeota archaeon]